MSKRKRQEWLLDELEEWVDADLITAEQARSIRHYYGDQEQGRVRSIAFILIAVTAALLIGGGIVLLLANGWEQLDEQIRVLISVLPLGLGAAVYTYAYWRHRRELAWREGVSVFFQLTIIASLGLLSYTLDWWQDDADFLLAWLLLSLPLCYGMGSILVAIIYLFGAASWVVQAADAQRPAYFLLLLGLFPFLLPRLHRSGSLLRRNLLSWSFGLSFFFSWLALGDPGMAEWSAIGTALWLVLFAGYDRYFHPDRSHWVSPFQVQELLGTFVLLLLFSSRIDLESSLRLFDDGLSALQRALLLGMTLAWSVLGVLGFRQKRWRSVVQLLHYLLPLWLGLHIMLWQEQGEVTAVLLTNFFALGFGAAYLYEGVTLSSLFRINVGMFLVLSLAGIRFFDAEWDLVVKGVLFILLGLIFLGVNALLARKGIS